MKNLYNQYPSLVAFTGLIVFITTSLFGYLTWKIGVQTLIGSGKEVLTAMLLATAILGIILLLLWIKPKVTNEWLRNGL